MKKITEVDSITDIADTDKIFVCSGNDIKQITKQNLLKSMQTQVDTISSSLLTETLFRNDVLFITKCGNSITATFRGLEISSSGTLVGVIDSKYFPKSLIFALVADGISMESKVLSIGTSGQLRPYSHAPAALSTTIKASGQAKWDI